jgi:hypothetical protein
MVTTYAVALAIAIVVTLAAMTFLLINSRSLVRLLRNERVAGPKVRDARSWSTPDWQVMTALGAFILGTLAWLGIYVGAIASA